jgi:hypothetical protein
MTNPEMARIPVRAAEYAMDEKVLFNSFNGFKSGTIVTLASRLRIDLRRR